MIAPAFTEAKRRLEGSRRYREFGRVAEVVGIVIESGGPRARVGDPDAIFEFFRSENVPELSEKDSSINSPYESEEVITEELF